MAGNKQFTATVDKFVTESSDRMLAMMRYALGDMVNDMQEPTGKGGRMRVDTGFLRASGRASLDGYPTGNGVRPTGATANQFGWDGQALVAVLAKMQLGDTFYFGWVANYAPIREVYDGFMSLPIQNWQNYVNKAVGKVKEGVG